jgi:hypothetical protein
LTYDIAIFNIHVGGFILKKLSLLSLTFAILFAVFLIGPSLLVGQLGVYPLIKVGDIFDIFTPLILIPLYWLLFQLGAEKTPGLKASLIFMMFAAIWVEGQGMHLAANSIGHLLKGMENSHAYNLTSFYDEVLSHFLWHFGILGLASLVIFRQWRNPFKESQYPSWLIVLSGIIHGITLFIIVIEARTTPLGITFTTLVTLFALIWGRINFNRRPILLFFFVACVVATVLFIGWGIYWQGLPEFSEVGIIN